MPIKINYQSKISGKVDVGAIADDLCKASDMMQSDILDCLMLACLEVVREARSLPSPPVQMRNQPHQPNYIDNTGVLRSSIGFVIYDHGKQHFCNFSGAGAAEGMKTAESVAQKYKNDVVAVICAGAMYAAYVESKGYKVLTNSASSLAERFNQKLQRIIHKK